MKRSSPPLPEDYTRRELESFHKAFAAGNEWGLADVLTFCKDHAVPLPSWALDAVMARHAEAYHGAYERTADTARLSSTLRNGRTRNY